MNKINYQKKMEQTIRACCGGERVQSLLLHSCCGPCSTYCIECLAEYFHVAVYYYNPNIDPPGEYELRAREQERFVREFSTRYPVRFVEEEYEREHFYEMARGMEALPEGGARCFACYELRMRKAAAYAVSHGFDFFTTTLSISPLKDAEKINEIGARLEREYAPLRFLCADFKKKDGFKRSVQLSGEYGMYRQNYCGCVFSRRGQERDFHSQ